MRPLSSFKLSVKKEAVFINQVPVIGIGKNAKVRRMIFDILFEQYLQDYQSCVLPDDYKLLKVDDIVARVSMKLKDSLMKDLGCLDNLEEHIRENLYKIQKTVQVILSVQNHCVADHNAVVETRSWSDHVWMQNGYRLNPYLVLVK